MYKRFCDICGKEITSDSDCAVVCTKIDRGTAALNGLAGRNKKRLMALGVEMCEKCYGKFYDMYLSYKAERKRKQLNEGGGILKCNIRTTEWGIKEVPCYKTEYKNVVITKVDEHCYSITHWQTGAALSSNIYRRRKDAFDDLPKVIEKIRKTKINIKQFCKRNKLKQINF